MVDRIERVARIKDVEYDVGRSFERKEGYRDQQEKRKFSEVLQSVMKRGVKQESSVPEPYRLELNTRATQSLFYQNGVELSRWEDRMNATG